MDFYILKSIAILLILIAVLLGIALLLRRFSEKSSWWSGTKEGKLLRIQETLIIDPKHRVILLMHGAQEHLVLIGPQNTLQLSCPSYGIDKGIAKI